MIWPLVAPIVNNPLPPEVTDVTIAKLEVEGLSTSERNAASERVVPTAVSDGGFSGIENFQAASVPMNSGAR